MLFYDLIRTTLSEYDDMCVENFINENCESNHQIDDIDEFIEKTIIINRFEDWSSEPDYHYSVWKWNGQYLKDGEEKLEYIGELHYNKNTYYDEIDRFILKNFKSIRNFEELYCFDLTTGNPDNNIISTIYYIIQNYIDLP